MAEKIKELTILLWNASGSVGRYHVREVFPALSLTSNALSQAPKPVSRSLAWSAVDGRWYVGEVSPVAEKNFQDLPGTRCFWHSQRQIPTISFAADVICAQRLAARVPQCVGSYCRARRSGSLVLKVANLRHGTGANLRLTGFAVTWNWPGMLWQRWIRYQHDYHLRVRIVTIAS